MRIISATITRGSKRAGKRTITQRQTIPSLHIADRPPDLDRLRASLEGNQHLEANKLGHDGWARLWGGGCWVRDPRGWGGVFVNWILKSSFFSFFFFFGRGELDYWAGRSVVEGESFSRSDIPLSLPPNLFCVCAVSESLCPLSCCPACKGP